MSTESSTAIQPIPERLPSGHNFYDQPPFAQVIDALIQTEIIPSFDRPVDPRRGNLIPGKFGRDYKKAVESNNPEALAQARDAIQGFLRETLTKLLPQSTEEIDLVHDLTQPYTQREQLTDRAKVIQWQNRRAPRGKVAILLFDALAPYPGWANYIKSQRDTGVYANDGTHLQVDENYFPTPTYATWLADIKNAQGAVIGSEVEAMFGEHADPLKAIHESGRSTAAKDWSEKRASNTALDK